VTASPSASGSRTRSDGSSGARAASGGLETNPPGCTPAAVPSFGSLTESAKLSDPFRTIAGTRISRRSEWACRRAEISAEAQQFEYGPKPPPPPSVTGSASGHGIVVTAALGGKSISFTAKVTLPTTGKAPYPALIGIGKSSLDNQALANEGVALVTFPNDDLAAQKDGASRGKGKFYDLYGSDNPAGAVMAWAWGVSRLIDVIDQTPATEIDPHRIGVTGCSRNGKGALAVGAFDERVVLTIVQESGSGGAASWRVSDAQLASGKKVQTLSEIVDENVWFTDSFRQFSGRTRKLPYDQHMVEALVAPRALLVIENTSIDWLGPESTFTSAVAANLVWQALGMPDRMGFSQFGNHAHCVVPAPQQSDVDAFVRRFLVGDVAASTAIMKTDGEFTYDAAKWQDWAVPTLE
jgi:hypothetical protein